MSDTTASLQRKINSAGDLQSVVRTMKAMAASNIGQYERAVRALGDYYRSVELGLSICFRKSAPTAPVVEGKGRAGPRFLDAVVFGSDQGLVGRFNDMVADYAVKTLAAMPGKHRVWAVGERAHARLTDAGLPLMGVFTVRIPSRASPRSSGRFSWKARRAIARAKSPNFTSSTTARPPGRLMRPSVSDCSRWTKSWRMKLVGLPWPTGNLPEVMGEATATLRALIREYLFISLFRACAESLSSENASRLAAMQRADKNIDELLEDLNGAFHRLRQSGIDEELFDVISGFEALNVEQK